jgi:hypothetical protein
MAADPFDVEPPMANTAKRAEALNNISVKLPVPVTVKTENLPERFDAFINGVSQYLEEYDDEYPEWLVEALPDLFKAYQSPLADDYTKAVTAFCDLAQQKMQQEGIENVVVAARELDKDPEQLLKELFQIVEEFRLMNFVSAKRNEQYWFEDFELDRLSSSIEDLRMEKQINLAALKKDYFDDIAKPLFVNHAVDRLVRISTDYVDKTGNFAFAHVTALAQFYGSATILRKLFQNAEKQRQEMVSLIQRSELLGLADDLADIAPDDRVSGYKAQMLFLAYVLSAEEEFKTNLDPLVPTDKTPRERQAAVFNALSKDYVLERDADALFERGRASMLYRLNYLLDLSQGSPQQVENYTNSKLYRNGFNVVNDLIGDDKEVFLAVFAQRAIQVYLEMLIEDVADDVGPKDEAGVLVSELEVLQTVMMFHGIYEEPIYFDPEILNPETNGERLNLMITENIKTRLGDRAMELKLFREDAEAPENEKIGFWFEAILGASVVAGAAALSIFGLSGVQNATKSVWKYLKTHTWQRRLLLAAALTIMVYVGVFSLASKKKDLSSLFTAMVYDTQGYWAKYTRGAFSNPLVAVEKVTVGERKFKAIRLFTTDYVNSAATVLNFTLMTKLAIDMLVGYRNTTGNSLEQTRNAERKKAISTGFKGWVKTTFNSGFYAGKSILFAGYSLLVLDVYNLIRVGAVKITGAENVDALSSFFLSLWQSNKGVGGEIVKDAQETFIYKVLGLLKYAYTATRFSALIGVPLAVGALWASNAYAGNTQNRRLLTLVGVQSALAFAASAVMNNDPLLQNIPGFAPSSNPELNLEFNDSYILKVDRPGNIAIYGISQVATVFALSLSAVTFAEGLVQQLSRSNGSNVSNIAEENRAVIRQSRRKMYDELGPFDEISPDYGLYANANKAAWVIEAKEAAFTTVAARYSRSERLRQQLANDYQSTLEEIKQADEAFRFE